MMNKRSIENTLIQPREQLKVILVFVGTGVVFLGIFAVAFIFTMNSTLHEISALADSSPAIMRSLEKSLSLSIYVTVSIAVLLSIVLVIAGFALSHRLYGPTVQIKRLMHRLALGDYKARGQLRKGDAFHDLMSNLNSLADELDRRHNGNAATGAAGVNAKVDAAFSQR